jgi:hypothetical protein
VMRSRRLASRPVWAWAMSMVVVPSRKLSEAARPTFRHDDP